MTRPTTSVSLARPSDDVSVLTKGTTVGNTIRRDFIRQVKQKEHQILDELQRLQDEMTAMEQTKAMLPSLQNKHSSLTASILQMEGQLTDYNLANDRFSRHVLPSELEEANAALAMNNGVLAKELNAAMLDTQEQEDNLQSIKDQVDARYHEIETKMLEQGGEDQLQRFRNLRKVMDNLQTKKKRREEEINDMGEKIEELEDSAEGQGLREREALSTKVSQLQAKLKCLQDEENALAMPISEAREFLMTATEATERSIADCDQELEQLDLNMENVLALRDNLLSELTSLELKASDGSVLGDSVVDSDSGPMYQTDVEQTNGHVSPIDDLAALEDRRMQLEEELVKYDDLVSLQARSDQARDSLKKRKKALMEKIAEAKPIVTGLSAICEENKAKLKSNGNWPSLQQMEETQANQKHEIASLEEFVESKGNESEYNSVKSGCLTLARSLNDNLVVALQ